MSVDDEHKVEVNGLCIGLFFFGGRSAAAERALLFLECPFSGRLFCN